MADVCGCGNEPSGSVKMRWAGQVAHMGEERGVYRVLVGKPEGRMTTGQT